ncbi:hypothetical protein GGS26DRAFT_150218 [Hypomontagnella submonticulosa]|nr:hypothetical protein GGS26DRAFT_150218 [Hypomontagnella submonticulosa]
MAPTFVLSVAYPSGGKFDLDYYLKSHMPLVQAKWAKYGLRSWQVAQYTNPDAPYVVQAWLEFEQPEKVSEATASAEGKEIFADIPNFYDKTAVTLSGPLAGAASWHN